MPIVPTALLKEQEVRNEIYNLVEKYSAETVAAACAKIVEDGNPGINIDVTKVAAILRLNKRDSMNESRLISRSQIRRIIAEEISKL